MQPLLQISGLTVHFLESPDTRIRAVNGASLEVFPGEVLGVLGESGSGKSTLAKTLLRLLPANAQIMGGSIKLEGQDVLRLSELEMEKVRGARIAMIPQDPSLALNPVMKIGDQIAEVVRAHRNWTSRQCRREAELLLDRVQLADARRRMYDAYPHELSGGQQQRVVIAQSLSCQPTLVIADEPTASLDSDTEREILSLFRQLKLDLKMSLLLITHDPSILAGLADRVAVMYAGRVVETGRLEQVFREPRHPYTIALLACAESGREREKVACKTRLPTIEGSSPDVELIAPGCSFAPRCAQRLEACEDRKPAAAEIEDGRKVECFLYGR